MSPMRRKLFWGRGDSCETKRGDLKEETTYFAIKESDSSVFCAQIQLVGQQNAWLLHLI